MLAARDVAPLEAPRGDAAPEDLGDGHGVMGLVGQSMENLGKIVGNLWKFRENHGTKAYIVNLSCS